MLDFLVFAVTMIAIWSVVALSLDLQFGLCGLVNFGQILPFALGAYGPAISAAHGGSISAGLALGLAMAAVGGVLVLAPVGRLSQDYWALVSLGASEIFRLLMVNVTPIAGGQDGTAVARVSNPLAALGLALGLLLAMLLLARRIDRSPLGRLMRVLREDDLLVATLGRNPFRVQALVTVVAWLMAALAGALYAHVVGFVAPSSFSVAETFIVWTALILGGAGSLLGAVVGTAFVQFISVSTRFLAAWSGLPFDLVANLRLGIFGVVLVLVFLLRREGLVPERKVRVDAVGP
ncbi:branched-chain amino acid ABC transporter permease [Lichenifustis flavocetrariae]|uniref:Branched-chain amino acid ABC transporter permease n=1 Tax=Lichenifustis flavocetrariae TaxID=2949735 RepID=A0AA41Z362_9HYPH|nr:branched-chain amino acid ABC transporter permease [Lichenifustis flavocetrariae]MCW6509668.1 branched-chain amino acid ABC transporter permease [Lichenifustis flavocetrariae]